MGSKAGRVSQPCILKPVLTPVLHAACRAMPVMLEVSRGKALLHKRPTELAGRPSVCITESGGIKHHSWMLRGPIAWIGLIS